MLQTVGKIVLPRLVATAVAVLLAAWAVTGFISLSEGRAARSLAAAIDAGDGPKLEALDRSFEGRSLEPLLERCDASTLNALATVGLAEVDLATTMADPIRSDRASDVAEAAIRQALRCAPLSGDLWLKLAALDTVRRGPSARTVELIKLSHWTAPSEGWIVRRRVDLASRLYESGVKDVGPELHSDIRTLVNFDASGKIADMFVAAPHSVRPIYREWIELLPPGRKSDVTKAVERRGSSLTGG
jgi:hypothetical protein